MYSIYIYNKRYSSNRCVSDSMSACHVLGLSLSVDTKKSDSGAHMVMILNHKQTNKQAFRHNFQSTLHPSLLSCGFLKAQVEKWRLTSFRVNRESSDPF